MTAPKPIVNFAYQCYCAIQFVHFVTTCSEDEFEQVSCIFEDL